MELATNEELQPIADATEGNPLLIKLFVTRFLTGHLPLKFVLQELKAVNKLLGKNIVEYLYSKSLSLLEQQCGEDDAHGIMNAFCPLSVESLLITMIYSDIAVLKIATPSIMYCAPPVTLP